MNPPAPIPPEPTAAKPPIDVFKEAENVFEFVQRFLALIAGMIAVLTGAGFLIVNVYLAKFTQIHGFDINVSQYLAAGIGFLLVLLAAALATVVLSAVITFLARQKNETIRTIVNAIVIAIAITLTSRLSFSSELANFINVITFTILGLRFVVEILPDSLHNRLARYSPRNSRNIVQVGLFLLLGLGGTFFYSQYGYGSLPHYLGGGAPEPIVLSFGDGDTAQALGLSVEAGEPRRTQTVLLLAELSNGLLVADTVNGRVVEVSNSQVIGRIDTIPLKWVITPTPPLPTPAATETAIP